MNLTPKVGTENDGSKTTGRLPCYCCFVDFIGFYFKKNF